MHDGASANTNDDERVITKIFVESLPSMVRARNFAGYARLFASDAMWCPSGAAARTGPAAIEQGVEGVLATLDIDPIFYADEVRVMGSFGYVFGRSKETLHPRDGSPSSIVYSRELWLFRKESDGWKIARMIFNFEPE